MSTFELYQDRRKEFRGVHSEYDWRVKVYTITLNDCFQSDAALEASFDQLLEIFLQPAIDSKLPVYQQAFIIFHEAREGVWILFNWWTGGEMIESIVRFASYTAPTTISPSPYTGSLVCTWELEVIIHERRAWIDHVLNRPDSPDFIGYQNDFLNETKQN